ncbi:siderophore-interacting protein [Clavibacter michiganensis subsp. michiganensis]|uniref:siderophore-interacting protein n=1 Tax=Clavibacter michiganensis TaxID=28447 RepID=UPI001365D4AF|nr:siderophore-interacting protein [Clavibacter michiganensis]MWJ80704.1 siderophore-interacting protein [Clavibacter michiganensis subsp. michiganensis]
MPTATPHPPYRLFETRVARTERVSPAFVRVTLVGPTLHLFAPWGLDQRIKLVLPRPDGAGAGWAGPLAGDVDGLAPDDWRHRVAGMPPTERHPLRTYTPRVVRPETGEVDVDLLVHEPAGPASAWALAARPGDRLLVSGPDVRADDRRHGIQWRPTVPPTRVLLAGDEAAVPALAGIMLTLDADVQGVVLVEADAADACPPIDARPAGVEVRDVRRIPGSPGAALADALADWATEHAVAAVADGPRFAAWIAAESTAIPALRAAVAAHGVDPGRIQAQGYWRAAGRGSTAEEKLG